MKRIKVLVALIMICGVLSACAGNEKEDITTESTTIQESDIPDQISTVNEMSEDISESETEVSMRYTPIEYNELIKSIKEILSNPPAIGESMSNHLQVLAGALEDTVRDSSSYWYVYYSDPQCWYDSECLKANFIRQVILSDYVAGMDGSIEKFSDGYAHTLWTVECNMTDSAEAIEAYDNLVEWMKSEYNMTVSVDSREGTSWTTRSQDDFSEVSLFKSDIYDNNGGKVSCYQLTVKRGLPSAASAESTSDTETVTKTDYVKPLLYDQLIASLKSILGNPPAVGESMKDHLQTMDGALPDTVSENYGHTSWSVQYTSGNYMRDENAYTSNYILSVHFQGFQTGMDGTIEKYDDGGLTPWSVQCVLTDYNEAERAYDEMLSWLQSDCGMVVSNERKEGTSWMTEEYNGSSISMYRDETTDFDSNTVYLYHLNIVRALK